MTKLTSTTLAAALVIPGLAVAQINIGDAVGTTEADMRAALTLQGYAVTEFEIEDDEIEVEALLDGVLYEIEVSSETGMVVGIALEDDDQDDDS